MYYIEKMTLQQGEKKRLETHHEKKVMVRRNSNGINRSTVRKLT